MSGQLLFVDLDDTLFRTQERRVEWMTREMGRDYARLYISGARGSSDDGSGADMGAVRDYCRQLDHDPEFYRGLPLVTGALSGLRMIEAAGYGRVFAYLSARPLELLKLSVNELASRGFPDAPVFCRPNRVRRRSAAGWKLSHVLQVNRSGSTRVIIDDDPQVGVEAARRCPRQTGQVSVILFAEPTTSVAVAEHARPLDWCGIANYLHGQP